MASPAPTGEKAQVQQHYNQLDRAGGLPSEGPSASTSSPRSPAAPAPAPAPNRGATPPPYSGPSSPQPAEQSLVNEEQRQRQLQQHLQDVGVATPRPPQRYPGLPRLDYSLYSPATFEILPGATGIQSSATFLSTNDQALLNLVRSQATLPPKPIIEIRGNRGSRVDFNVRCNLMSLIVPDDRRDRLDYLRCVSPAELALRGGSKPKTTPHHGTLEAWVRAYLEDQSHPKCFVLERQVVNLDVNFIEGQIRTMVAAMGYSGLLTVAFPVLHSRVVVNSPDRVNRFFTSVSALFAGRKTYEVVKAVWPYATHCNKEAGRRCVVQSEETWWREWRDPIKLAIATKRIGWVTNEDKLEVMMEGNGKGAAPVDWGSEYDT